MNPGTNEEVKVHTNVIKRNGQEVTFDISKIINAIGKANNEVNEIHQLNEFQIRAIADNIANGINIKACAKMIGITLAAKSFKGMY